MIRLFLRQWLGITAHEERAVLADNDLPAICKRLDELEAAQKAQEDQHTADIAELRERLDNRVPRGNNPHRSFQMMRKVAEMGELAARSKNVG